VTKKQESTKKTSSNKPNVVWNDNNMRSTYANVCNVASTREEFTLLFGTNQSWHMGHNELKVDLSDRMILNPYAAKRLSVLLNGIIQEYETRFGEISLAQGEKATVN